MDTPPSLAPATTTARQTVFMPRLIPEHTIDSSLAYEILRAHPTAALWSPTPTAGSYDHKVRTRTSTWIFECKGADPATGSATAWRTPHIDAKQLSAYLARFGGRVIYLFLAEPTTPDKPWLRSCACAPGTRTYCNACRVTGPRDPAVERRWAGLDQIYMGQKDPHRLVQAWFNHWAWCITATDLNAHLATHSPRPGSFTLADATCEAIPGAVRLCHFLDAANSLGGDGDDRDGESTAGDNNAPRNDLGDERAGDSRNDPTISAAALCADTQVGGDELNTVLSSLVESLAESTDNTTSPPLVMTIGTAARIEDI